jgi:hypothetical protein
VRTAGGHHASGHRVPTIRPASRRTLRRGHAPAAAPRGQESPSRWEGPAPSRPLVVADLSARPRLGRVNRSRKRGDPQCREHRGGFSPMIAAGQVQRASLVVRTCRRGECGGSGQQLFAAAGKLRPGSHHRSRALPRHFPGEGKDILANRARSSKVPASKSGPVARKGASESTAFHGPAGVVRCVQSRHPAPVSRPGSMAEQPGVWILIWGAVALLACRWSLRRIPFLGSGSCRADESGRGWQGS